MSVKSTAQLYLEREHRQRLAKSIVYQALKDTKTYLKLMELHGHVPILRPHQKIMAEIDSALEQRKELFK